MNAIEIQHLTKIFHPHRALGPWLRKPWQATQRLAVDDVSLSVAEGELVCLMGSNGAGKTTLLKILAGLLLPTSGTVAILGADGSVRDHKLRAKIGWVPGENPGFYDRLSCRENLEFFAALYGLSGSQAKLRIDGLFERLSISTGSLQFQECATGVKQRLMIARALLHDPPVLLLDEPSKSIDPVQREQFYHLVKEQLNGELRKTILLSTHKVEEAERLAGRIAVLHEGKLRGYQARAELADEGDLGTAIRRLCSD